MPPPAITVAAVQMACELGNIDGNLRRAGAFVEQAALRGAKLVLLPELTPGGYTLTERIWETAEPFDGPSTRWLRSTAARLGIYLGSGETWRLRQFNTAFHERFWKQLTQYAVSKGAAAPRRP